MLRDDLLALAIDDAAQAHHVTAEEVLGRRRTRAVAAARRQVYRELVAHGFSPAEVGAMLGRNRTTVSNGARGAA